MIEGMLELLGPQGTSSLMALKNIRFLMTRRRFVE